MPHTHGSQHQRNDKEHISPMRKKQANEPAENRKNGNQENKS